MAWRSFRWWPEFCRSMAYTSEVERKILGSLQREVFQKVVRIRIAGKTSGRTYRATLTETPRPVSFFFFGEGEGVKIFLFVL